MKNRYRMYRTGVKNTPSFIFQPNLLKEKHIN
jgi:hypothetical protein